jgi:hypothetical protein
MKKADSGFFISFFTQKIQTHRKYPIFGINTRIDALHIEYVFLVAPHLPDLLSSPAHLRGAQVPPQAFFMLLA